MIELRDVIAIVAIMVTLAGGYWALAKFIGRLFRDHLDAKFEALNQRLQKIEESERQNGDAVTKVERDLMQLRAELPEKYVRSEDHIRGQSRLEAKIDALALGLQRAATGGAHGN